MKLQIIFLKTSNTPHMEFEKLIFKCTVILKYKTFVSSVYIIPVLEENGWIKNQQHRNNSFITVRPTVNTHVYNAFA